MFFNYTRNDFSSKEEFVTWLKDVKTTYFSYDKNLVEGLNLYNNLPRSLRDAINPSVNVNGISTSNEAYSKMIDSIIERIENKDCVFMITAGRNDRSTTFGRLHELDKTYWVDFTISTTPYNKYISFSKNGIY